MKQNISQLQIKSVQSLICAAPFTDGIKDLTPESFKMLKCLLIELINRSYGLTREVHTTIAEGVEFTREEVEALARAMFIFISPYYQNGIHLQTILTGLGSDMMFSTHFGNYEKLDDEEFQDDPNFNTTGQFSGGDPMRYTFWLTRRYYGYSRDEHKVEIPISRETIESIDFSDYHRSGGEYTGILIHCSCSCGWEGLSTDLYIRGSGGDHDDLVCPRCKTWTMDDEIQTTIEFDTSGYRTSHAKIDDDAGRRQKAFADAWQAQHGNNLEPSPDFLSVLLSEKVDPNQSWVSHRVTLAERLCAGTLMQWLGTNIGFKFLEETLRTLGLKIVSIDEG